MFTISTRCLTYLKRITSAGACIGENKISRSDQRQRWLFLFYLEQQTITHDDVTTGQF